MTAQKAFEVMSVVEFLVTRFMFLLSFYIGFPQKPTLDYPFMETTPKSPEFQHFAQIAPFSNQSGARRRLQMSPTTPQDAERTRCLITDEGNV